MKTFLWGGLFGILLTLGGFYVHNGKQKHMGYIVGMSCQQASNGNFCFVQRGNNDIFLADFVDAFPNLSVATRDVVYVDTYSFKNGWQQKVVVIVPLAKK